MGMVLHKATLATVRKWGYPHGPYFQKQALPKALVEHVLDQKLPDP